CSPQAMQTSAEHVASAARGRLGVSARNIETGETFSYHGGRSFPMQSVYKLPIALTVFRQVEDGKLKLDQPVHVPPEELIPPAAVSPLRDTHPRGGDFTVEDLLRRAIVDSDGSASDALLHELGG